MPRAICDSCNKRYKVPQEGKEYRCKCGGTVIAKPDVTETVPQEQTEKKTSRERGMRIKSRRNAVRKKKTIKKYIFGGALAVLVIMIAVVPYQMMKPQSLRTVAKQFAVAWNETGGIEDMEGLSKLVDFFMEDSREVVKKRFIARFPVYKWLKQKPHLGDPVFPADQEDESSNKIDPEGIKNLDPAFIQKLYINKEPFDDNKYKSFEVFYPITAGDQKVLHKIFWKRNSEDCWRIKDMTISPAFRDLPQLSLRFKEIWNEEEDIEITLNRIAQFFPEEDRDMLTRMLGNYLNQRGWQTVLPGLVQPTTYDKLLRIYGIGIKVEYPVADAAEALWVCWIKKKTQWYVREIMSPIEVTSVASTNQSREPGIPIKKTSTLRQTLKAGDVLTYKVAKKSSKKSGTNDSDIEHIALMEMVVKTVAAGITTLEGRVTRIRKLERNWLGKENTIVDTGIDQADSEVIAALTKFMQGKRFMMQMDSRGQVLKCVGLSENEKSMNDKIDFLLENLDSSKKYIDRRNIEEKVREICSEYGSLSDAICWWFPYLPYKPVATGSEWGEQNDLFTYEKMKCVMKGEGRLGNIENKVVNAYYTCRLKKEMNDAGSGRRARIKTEAMKLNAILTFDLGRELITRKSIEILENTYIAGKKLEKQQIYMLELMAYNESKER